MALDGITRRADAPFWQTHYPPNGWGCRCRVVGARGPASIRRLGGDADKPMPGWVGEIDPRTGAPVGIDKGFAYPPGASVADEVSRIIADKMRRLPPPLASSLAEDERTLRLGQSMRAAHADVLEAAGKDRPGIEYAALISTDGRRAWLKRGVEREVPITDAELAGMRGGMLTHNHPSGVSLSLDDLRLMLAGGLRRICAVAQGRAYSASMVRGVTDERLVREHAEAHDRVFRAMMNLIRNGAISKGDAEAYHWHAVNKLLARRGVIRYHTVISGGVPNWVHDVIEGLR